MKIKTKNAKNCVTSAINLPLNKDFILKTPKREVRSEVHMERHYEGSNILFLESRANPVS